MGVLQKTEDRLFTISSGSLEIKVAQPEWVMMI